MDPNDCCNEIPHSPGCIWGAAENRCCRGALELYYSNGTLALVGCNRCSNWQDALDYKEETREETSIGCFSCFNESPDDEDDEEEDGLLECEACGAYSDWLLVRDLENVGCDGCIEAEDVPQRPPEAKPHELQMPLPREAC